MSKNTKPMFNLTESALGDVRTSDAMRSCLGRLGVNPVLEGQTQPKLSVLQVDNTFTWGSTYLGESSSCLVGCKSRQVPSTKDAFQPGFASYQGETAFAK